MMTKMIMTMRQNEDEHGDEHEGNEDDEQESYDNHGNSGDAADDPHDESYEDDDGNAITIMKMTRMNVPMTTATRSIHMTILKKIRGRAKRGRRI